MNYKEYLHSLAYETEIEGHGIVTMLPNRRATKEWSEMNPEAPIVVCQRPSDSKVGFSTIIFPMEYMEEYVANPPARKEGLEVKFVGSYDECVDFFHEFLIANGVTPR